MPQKVKKQLGFKPDDRLLAVRINKSILLARMESLNIQQEFGGAGLRDHRPVS